jgi:hypothetical protein
MVGGRLYVVTDPNLIATVQRHYKELSFWFLEGAFTVKLGGLTKDGAQRLTQNATGREAGASLLIDGMKAIHVAMNSGLYAMIQVATEIVVVAMDMLEEKGVAEVDLWQWIDRNVSSMTTGAVYGPLDPYRDPAIASSLKYYSIYILFAPSDLRLMNVTNTSQRLFTGQPVYSCGDSTQLPFF